MPTSVKQTGTEDPNGQTQGRSQNEILGGGQSLKCHTISKVGAHSRGHVSGDK